MMTNGDRVDLYSLSKLIDRDLGVTEQRLKDSVFRAFHEKEYNSPL